MGCTLINPSVNGVCGQPNIGDCSVGLSSGTTNPWTCQGSNGGANATCYHGECGAANNTCVQGTPNNIVGSAEWLCEGNIVGNADDTRCVIAVCGDTQGTCDQGTPSGNTNSWDCSGANTSINCNIGVCHFNTLGHAGGCDEGVSSDPSGNPWTCQGSYHETAITTDDDDCFIGACGSADNNIDGCPVGTWVDVPDLTSPPVVRWKCEGSDGGTDDDIICEQEVGDCAATLGDCVQGISSDPRGATNPWVCAGTGGGSDETCVFSVCGTQDNAAQGCLPNMLSLDFSPC